MFHYPRTLCNIPRAHAACTKLQRVPHFPYCYWLALCCALLAFPTLSSALRVGPSLLSTTNSSATPDLISTAQQIVRPLENGVLQTVKFGSSLVNSRIDSSRTSNSSGISNSTSDTTTNTNATTTASLSSLTNSSSSSNDSIPTSTNATILCSDSSSCGSGNSDSNSSTVSSSSGSASNTSSTQVVSGASNDTRRRVFSTTSFWNPPSSLSPTGSTTNQYWSGSTGSTPQNQYWSGSTGSSPQNQYWSGSTGSSPQNQYWSGSTGSSPQNKYWAGSWQAPSPPPANSPTFNAFWSGFWKNSTGGWYSKYPWGSPSFPKLMVDLIKINYTATLLPKSNSSTTVSFNASASGRNSSVQVSGNAASSAVSGEFNASLTVYPETFNDTDLLAQAEFSPHFDKFEVEDKTGDVNRDAGSQGGGGQGKPMKYRGGEVMDDVFVHMVYVGNEWLQGSASSNVTMAASMFFARHMGKTAWWNVTRYYNEQSSPKFNAKSKVKLAQAKIHSTASDAILDEGTVIRTLQYYIASGQLRFYPGRSVYVFMLPNTYPNTFTKFSGHKSCQDWCGFHNYVTTQIKDKDTGKGSTYKIPYAVVANPYSCGSNLNYCAAKALLKPNAAPNAVQADAMISFLAHEVSEVANDFDFKSWYDDNGLEHADKCATDFGKIYTNPDGKVYNIKVNGKPFLIQSNWDLNSQQCTMGIGTPDT